jgi:IS5 family transposase
MGVLGLLPMATDDFLRARPDTMIELRHRLAVLATRMPWAEIEAALAPAFAHRDRTGRLVEGKAPTCSARRRSWPARGRATPAARAGRCA